MTKIGNACFLSLETKKVGLDSAEKNSRTVFVSVDNNTLNWWFGLVDFPP